MNTEQLKQAALAASQGKGESFYSHPRDHNNWKNNEIFQQTFDAPTALALLECVDALRGLLNRYDAYALPGYEKNVTAEDNARAALQKLEAL